MALFQGVGSVKPSAFSSAYEYVNVLLPLHLYSYEQCCHSYLLPIYMHPAPSQPNKFFEPFRIIERRRKEL